MVAEIEHKFRMLVFRDVFKIFCGIEGFYGGLLLLAWTIFLVRGGFVEEGQGFVGSTPVVGAVLPEEVELAFVEKLLLVLHTTRSI